MIPASPARPDVERTGTWTSLAIAAVGVVLSVVVLAHGWRLSTTVAQAEPAATSSRPSVPTATTATPDPTGSDPTSQATPEPETTDEPFVEPGDAVAAELILLLGAVTVIDKQPQVDGYDRDCGPGDGCVFGTEWSDDTDAPDGHNGCDTRNDVLRRDLIDVQTSEGSNGCDVVAGTLLDPYTGTSMNYATDGSNIHIDHLIPLAAAWDLGAWQWTAEQRTRFANDTDLELLAVNGSANMSKSDSTPASWLPPNMPYRCTYLAAYLRVAQVYDLPITRTDHTVISRAATKC